MKFHSRDDRYTTKLWRLTDGPSMRCERQDLTLASGVRKVEFKLSHMRIVLAHCQ
jgi:hypothetical protein